MVVPRPQPRPRRHPLPLHPVWFALLPVLFLYAHNMAELHVGELLLPVLLATAAALLVWGALRALLRDWTRAAVLASAFWLWFCSFGHVSQLSERLGSEALLPLAIVYALLWPALVVLALGWRRPAPALSTALNVMALALVAFQVVRIGSFELRRAHPPTVPPSPASTVRVTAAPAREAPNIYFLVLDGYAREDVLRDIYRYDNHDFLRSLEAQGFQVAHHARANYCQTELTLASSLNLDYVDPLARAMGPEATDRAPLERAIADNHTTRFLRNHGYRTVAFASGYGGTELRAADSYRRGQAGLSEFQSALLETTPLLPLLRARGLVRVDANHTRARQVLYTLDHLAEAGRSPAPVFVFAHLIVPHPPFIFRADGSLKEYVRANQFTDGVRIWGSPRLYIRGYREQVEFISHRLPATIAAILAQAPRPTVILLLSDHGPGSTLDFGDLRTLNLTERFGILLAMRLPGKDVRLPDDFSPVNACRLVLREYFGADLPPLPSVSYASTFRHPYRLVRVTNGGAEFSWPPEGPPPSP